MHTYTCKNGTTFHYNSDLSGEVKITRRAGCPVTCTKRKLPEITFDHDLEINGDDILEFVAAHVQRERISRLEELSTSEILELRRVVK